MKIYDSEVLFNFLSKEALDKPIILLISPPFLLSESRIKILSQKQNYVTFNDIINMPMPAQLGETTILHLYTMPINKKNIKNIAKILGKHCVIFYGFNDVRKNPGELISYENFNKIINVKNSRVIIK